MADKPTEGFLIQFKRQWLQTTRRIRKSADTLAGRVNAFRLPGRDVTRKTAAKLVIAGAAIAAIAAMVIVNADLSPAALVRGMKDKNALSHATGKGYPLWLDGNHALSTAHIANGTAVLTDTDFLMLDKDGREILASPHYMANPVMKTAGRYTLLFDKRATNYNVKTLSGTICTGRTERSIINGTISRSGTFALITKHDTASSHLQIFGKNGEIRHKWRSSSYYLSDVALNSSGSLVAVCGVAANDDGQLKSCVIIQKVGGSENLREYVFDGTLLISVRFADSDNVVAIGDDLAARVSSGSDHRVTYSYEGSTLTGYDVAPGGSVALVLSQHSDGQNASVVVINGAGSETLRLETELTSPEVELTGSGINLLSQSRLYRYSLSGKLIRSVDISADSETVLTSEGKTLIKGISSVTAVD